LVAFIPLQRAIPDVTNRTYVGGIAIEDAGAICALLPLGTSKDDIPERLKLYEKIRDERAHKIQEYTRQAGADLSGDTRASFNSEFVD
jgi:hypothetical protein